MPCRVAADPALAYARHRRDLIHGEGHLHQLPAARLVVLCRKASRSPRADISRSGVPRRFGDRCRRGLRRTTPACRGIGEGRRGGDRTGLGNESSGSARSWRERRSRHRGDRDGAGRRHLHGPGAGRWRQDAVGRQPSVSPPGIVAAKRRVHQPRALRLGRESPGHGVVQASRHQSTQQARTDARAGRGAGQPAHARPVRDRLAGRCRVRRAHDDAVDRRAPQTRWSC